MLRFLPVFCLLIFAACTNPSSPSGESQTATTTPKANIEFKGTNGTEIEQEGFAKYDENPITAIPYFKKAIELFPAEDKYPKAALAYSNLASIYDDHLSQPDSALFYVEKSYDIWKQLNDEMQVANMLKYKGLIKSKMGREEEGIAEIMEAIGMYEKLKFNKGAAVAKFNLSIAYFKKNNYQKSLPLWQEATDFWKSVNEGDRVFTNNLFGLELYHKLGDLKKVKAIIAENEALLKTASKINDFNKNRFENLKGRLLLQAN